MRGPPLAGSYTRRMDIAALRKSYELDELDEAASAADPLRQFQHWFDQAVQAQLPEPNAMTLATVGVDGRPSPRVVLIKGCDARGIVWYTNYQSRKGVELAHQPLAALQFHWVELERVVRIEGRVHKTSAEESDAYYATRPIDSRLGAWASPQSQVIPSRSVLVAGAAKVAARHALNPPRPPHWGGYRLQPDRWEFWQGRKSRLHDRLQYRLLDRLQDRLQERLQDGLHSGPQAAADETGWLRERLAP